MEALARKAAKVLLFCGLFFLAGRYVHTYPLPMTLSQQHYLIVISETFGVADYEMFYIGSMIAIDLVVTILAYSILMRLWQRYCARE
ncbi:hypothetical protein [Paraburkholderia susongensis]|uniref:Uncharacterized protein n=1 Tax=Paraburkholderia susongensis TaxID=1515439 RepID=A0A1X7KTJ2_9BURK|nr:hypothetical protein [Paraburkholderia susongensis]SMG44204.1 hypothetical protein SAMN06265784_104234 [Paraburkholderia susongensis]